MVEMTKPDWASRPMRLDPYHLPHSVALGKEGTYSYKIDRGGAVLKRQLGCGLPVSMALPQKSFKGVAARAIILPDGRPVYTLELHHHDADLCLPVLVADNLDDISADWHAWSRLMQLPMLMVDEANIPQSVCNTLGAIMVEAPIARRKRITGIKRRPWFLRRRKIGEVGIVVKLSAAEIIARR